MLFAAFTSAYIVRRSGSDWRHVALPPILWLHRKFGLRSRMTGEVIEVEDLPWVNVIDPAARS